MSNVRLSGMDHFSRLNNSVYLHDPTERKDSPDTPDLILLVGWMGASLRHLAKYTECYEKLFPSARILVIRTEAVDFFRTYSTDLKRVAPILEALYDLPSGSKYLIHLFSNGGSWTTTTIAREYQKKLGKPLSANALILDSTPGKAKFKATLLALSFALPKNALLRFLAGGLLRAWLAVFMCFKWLGWMIDPVDQARRALNNKSLFDVGTPRLYIYGAADPMVDWRFVDEHAAEANALGYSVSSEKYEKSGHCMHMLLDQDRYWGAVKNLLV